MKRYIVAATSKNITKFNIVVELEYIPSDEVAAATYKGFTVPDGPVISGLPDAILDSQALADYEAFIESIQDLITEYYKLQIYYKNSSKDHSYYFDMLAKNDAGEIILDFDFTLRVSNHNPHRTAQSESHKKERKEALKQITSKATKPITKNIIVNDTIFDSYEDAYVKVDTVIESVVAVMKRKN